MEKSLHDPDGHRSTLDPCPEKNVNKLTAAVLAALMALMALPSTAQADEARAGGLEWSGSGFVSVVAGKVLKGTHDEATDIGYRCPCFVSDYAQNGVYERGGLQFGPDSRLGLQGTAALEGGRYALTGQVVSRGSRNGRVKLEWLYATAELTGNWTLQVGRKRLPLFMSSEVQDVGYALPWNHLPPQMYGWDIVNYNGASLVYRNTLGDWLATAQVLAGSETTRDAGYWRIYNGKQTETDSRWSHIGGGELKLSRGVFDVRAVMIQSYTQNRRTSDGETGFSPRAWQRIYGLSFNLDDPHWVARTEFLYINRRAEYGSDHSQLYAGGRRFGPLLLLASYANYQQTVNADLVGAEGHSTRSAVLRYDLDHVSAVKLQYDLWRDKVAPGYQGFHGNVHLLSVAYDRVF